MNDTSKHVVAIISSIVIITVAAIAAVAYSSQTRHQLMAKDIQTALDKGVNPIVIRCAYADEGDRICLVYAASRGTGEKVEMKSPTK